MKKAIGGAYVYNLIIIFLLIMFGFFLALFSYTKAYRVSKGVMSIIENHSGYNENTQKDIDKYLDGMGYNKIEIEKCPTEKTSAGTEEEAIASVSGLCIYKATETADKMYISYGVLSYMTIDLPLINLIRIPIYGETEHIYVFK